MRSSGARTPSDGQDAAEAEEHAAAHGEIGELVVGEGGAQAAPQVVAHVQVVEGEMLRELRRQALAVGERRARTPVGDLAVEALVDPGGRRRPGPRVSWQTAQSLMRAIVQRAASRSRTGSWLLV